MPPWEWRLARRGEASLVTRPPATAAPGGFTCGTKTYGREMTSCAEAMFHLRQCGLGRLDADRDGVPCESICR